jgi:hypothetical protein
VGKADFFKQLLPNLASSSLRRVLDSLVRKSDEAKVGAGGCQSRVIRFQKPGASPNSSWYNFEK